MISYAKKLICTRCGRIDYLDSHNKHPSSYTHIECKEIEPRSAFGKTINEVDLCSTCYGEFVDFILKEKKQVNYQDKRCVNCTYCTIKHGKLLCYAQKSAPQIINIKNTCERYEEVDK